jgi:methylmalonyl-CoA/ethylmalonyl-CoA epimerase
MPPRLHKIALVTEDVEGAVRFYTQTLGLQVLERFPTPQGEDFVFLKAGDLILELMPRKVMQTEPGFHHISFRTEDMDAAVEDLRAQGVAMERMPGERDANGLRLAFFRGPDRVYLQLFERRRPDNP